MVNIWDGKLLCGLLIGVVFLFKVYIFKFLLKIPSYHIALWRYLKMIYIGLFYLIVILVPFIGLSFAVKLLFPNIFHAYETMNEFFSVQKISTILYEGLSGKQLMWALFFISRVFIILYAQFYTSCYAYEQHIDTSVDTSRLKKTILFITVLGIVADWIISLYFF